MEQNCNLIMIFALVMCPSYVFMVAKGPYEATLYNISSCVTEQSWFRYNLSTYTSQGRVLVRGNFIANRVVSAPVFNLKMHYTEQGKGEPIDLKNLTCHHIVTRVVLRTLGVQYNSQKCIMKPTSAVLNNIDIASMLHTMKQTLWLGTVHIRWEVAEGANRFMCLDCYVQITKTKDTKNRQ